MSDKIKLSLISCYEEVAATGLRFLSAYLKSKGHHVSLILMPDQDSPGWEEGQSHRNPYTEKAVRNLAEHCRNSDLIGFSLMTKTFLKAKNLTLRLRKYLDIPIIYGGIHATVRPEECIKYADIICLGEGEEALLELAENYKSGDYTSIRNLWVKTPQGIKKNPMRPLEQDLDKYPHQDFDIRTHYVQVHDEIMPLNDELLEKIMPKNTDLGEPRSMYLLSTARNCPHNCTYCNNNALREVYRNSEGPFVRKRSVDNVIDELETVFNRYPIFQMVNIFDDTFFIRSREEVQRFSRLYKQKIGVPMRCSVSPHTLDEEKLKSLVDAGLYRTSVGIQTMDPDTLVNIYNRPTPKKVMDRTIDILKKYQKQIPRPVYHFIVDNYKESNKSLKTSLDFILSLPARSQIFLYPILYFPGTRLYTQAKKDGEITDEVKQIYLKSFEIEDVQNLNFLTTLFYFAVWAKFHPLAMKLTNPFIRFLMQDRWVSMLDRKVPVRIMYLLFKAYSSFIKTIGKLA